MLNLIQVVGVPTSFDDIGVLLAERVGNVFSATVAGGTFLPPVLVRDSDVSAYICGCVLSCLPGSSADGSLTDQIQTLDSCAKGVMKYVLKRPDALEKKVFFCLRKATT